MQRPKEYEYEYEGAEKLNHRCIDLKSRQVCLDRTLSNLKKEIRELKAASPPMKSPSPEIAPHFSYIYPLVEDVCLLELRERELKEEYHNSRLSAEARKHGQQLLTASLTTEETVLKTWYEELNELQNSQPAISTTSAESQEHSSVQNIVYNCTYDWHRLTEDLAVTVLCQAVHARVKIHSTLACSNIHLFTHEKADVSVNSDIHIPGLEETALRLLGNGSSINGVVSTIAAYIASDMAPFVISIPMKKKGKKKKKDKTDTTLNESPKRETE